MAVPSAVLLTGVYASSAKPAGSELIPFLYKAVVDASLQSLGMSPWLSDSMRSVS